MPIRPLTPSSAPRPRRRLAALAAVAAAVVGGALTAPAANAAPADPPEPLVVGGEPTTVEEHPFIVQLTDPYETQFCGGTLVAPTKVVTAAHCVDWLADPSSELRVVGGRTYLDGTDGTVAEVSTVWIHPDYDYATLTSDVAVVTLAEELPYETLPYVSETDTDVYTEGNPATLLGWGATSENGPSANQLQTAEVPVISDADCGDAYGGSFDPTAHVCAGLLAEGGVDTCQGDSGGPLVIDGRLAGIVSWGVGCARPGNPGVYTRLATYAPEVTEQVTAP